MQNKINELEKRNEALLEDQNNLRKQFNRKIEEKKRVKTMIEELNQKIQELETRNSILLAEKNLMEDDFITLEKYVKTQSVVASIGKTDKQFAIQKEQEQKIINLLGKNQRLEKEIAALREEKNVLEKMCNIKSIESSMNQLINAVLVDKCLRNEKEY